MKLEHHYFSCSCGDMSHTLRIVYDPDYNDAYIEPGLSIYLPWYSRLWLAIKYVFGHGHGHNSFDCFVFTIKDANMMAKLMYRMKVREAYLKSKIDKTWARAFEVLGVAELVEDWMNSPKPYLNDGVPSEMLDTEEGRKLVEDELGRIESGSCA